MHDHGRNVNVTLTPLAYLYSWNKHTAPLRANEMDHVARNGSRDTPTIVIISKICAPSATIGVLKQMKGYSSSGTHETKSVAELSAWLSDFGNKNRDHFENGVLNKSTRSFRIQQRVKQFESLSLVSSCSSSTEGSPVVASPLTKQPKFQSVKDASHHSPVFRTFEGGDAPYTLPRPPLSREGAAHHQQPPDNRHDDDFRVLGIAKLLEPPRPHRTCREISWDASDDDDDDNSAPLWSSVDVQIPRQDAFPDVETPKVSSRGARTTTRDDEAKSRLTTKLSLLRCKSKSLHETDSSVEPAWNSPFASGKKNPTTISWSPPGGDPGTSSNMLFPSNEYTAALLPTQQHTSSKKGSWVEEEISLPTLDNASLETVFAQEQLALEDHDCPSNTETTTATVGRNRPQSRAPTPLFAEQPASPQPRQGTSMVQQRHAQLAAWQAANRTPQFATTSRWRRAPNGTFVKRYSLYEATK
jgi:hypothetical protein